MKYDLNYWNNELQQTREGLAPFITEANEANRIYRAGGELDGVERRINVWWAYIQTILPAFYSNLPSLEVKRRGERGHAGHIVASLIWQRNLEYAIREGFHFGATAYDSILNWLVAGRGVLWARYEAEVEEKSAEYREIEEKEEGVEVIEGETSYSSVKKERAVLESIGFRDFIHQICTNPLHVEWKGRYAYMGKEQVKEKFGSDLAEKLDYNIYPNRETNKNSAEEYVGKTKLTEIWCRESGKVYWLGENKEERLIESGEPPINFNGFFPCSEITGYVPLESVIPLGDWTENKDIILEIERLNTRKHYAIQAVRFNAVFDSALQKEIAGIFSGDYKLIPNKNWQVYQGAGGLQRGVEFFDPTPYLNAIQFLNAEIQNQLKLFYDNTGASDLLRGATSPLETATAQQLKSNYSSLRFSVRQKQVYEFFNDAMNNLGEIIAEHYSTEYLLEVADQEDLVKKFPTLDPAKAIELILRSDERRRYAIEITNDSLSQLDERQERAERVDFIQSAGGFLQQMLQTAQSNPAMIQVAGHMLEFVLRSYKAGRELEGQIMSAFQQAVQAASQQQQPPDPAMIAEQTKLQTAQIEGQTKLQAAQRDAMIARMEAQAKQAEMQIKMAQIALEREKIQLELVKMQGEKELKDMELMQEATKQQGALVKEQLDTQQEIIKANGRSQVL